MKIKKYIPEIIIGILLIVIIGLSSYLLYTSKNPNIDIDNNNNSNVTRTIMIYMVGSNLESEYQIATSDLELIKPSSIDLNNIKVYLYTGGTKSWHNYISNKENAIYELTESGFKKIKTYSKLNMGDATTLSSFLNYGYNNSHTDEYDLIVYDHGGAIDGAVYDDFTDDNLSLSDFDEALSSSKFGENNKLELVLFRTCLNGTLEVANIFAPYAEYMIASEEVTNGAKGTSVLQFLNKIKQSDDPEEIGKKYINQYHLMINEIDPTGITVDPMYSIIDLSKVESLTNEFNKFIDSIDMEKYYSAIVRLRSNMFQYGYSYYGDEDYDMVDLKSLITGLSKYSNYDTTNLLKLYNNTVIYNNSVEENSHGLSIYFPYRGSNTSQFFKIYNKLEFNDSYLSFIQDFQKKASSKTSSSFANLSDASFANHEFTLQLTDKQNQDFAEAIYIVFNKDSDGYFTPIYSSDNMTITDDGLLKTNISNNLIKVTDTSGKSSYLIMIERHKTSDIPVLNTTASLFGYKTGELKASAANVYFTIDNGIPKITQFINISDGVILNIDDYEKIDFVNTKYKILDSDGNYMTTWERANTIDYTEVEVGTDYKFSLSTLDDGDYYCVFKIVDVYGNVFYSSLSSIN